MDFFSGKTPDLIGPTMKTTLTDIINKPKVGGYTVSEKVTSSITNFYMDYINDYKFVIVCIILIIVCLVFRYKYKNKEGFSNDVKDIKLVKKKKDVPPPDLIEEVNNLQFYYDGHLYMNPTQAIDQQENQTQVLYPADPLPINISPDQKIFTRNIYENPQPDVPLNNPDYDYNDVYKYPNNYYSGAYNTYKNAQDTTIENPKGFSNKFNTTMGNFVGPMTNMNMQSVYAYQTINDNKEYNMVDGANGSARFNIPSFERPYDE